ncbi:MAG: 30S ribosomal protein S4 [Defluviitaleaceae bacterium]|nr:30S ribosomal protein S4 [Defluviitaleaceae bacterium]
MAVDRTPILKRCRALGIEPMVLGINKKSNRNPQRGNRKVSEYGLQLREKQKAKFIYGVLEKQFRNYFVKASKMQGISGENLMKLLEMRLDNVVFRLGLARTRKEARQIVGHKLVHVNGKSVNIPSYRVKAGDVIEVRAKSSDSERFKDIVATTEARLVPAWLSSDLGSLKGSVTSLPSREEIDVPVNETLIVEFYSKML